MKTITIRNVPPETHNELVARAELAGQSLQEYLRSLLVETTKRPDPRTLFALVRDRKEKMGTRVPAELILAYRDLDRK